MFEQDMYTGLAVPYSFAGQGTLLKRFKNRPKAEVLDRLYSISAYTQFRPAKRPYRYNPIYVTDRRQLIQADLVDMSQLSNFNGGVQYILMCVDSFSRKLFARLLKNKKASTTLHAFQDILREMGQIPERLGVDRGSEFKASFFDYASQRDIKVEFPRHKYPGVERVNLTLKRLLYMYMGEYMTRRYVDIFPLAVNVYNSRVHRVIKMTPNDADKPENRGKVLSKQLAFQHRKKKKPKYRLGDIVRVQKPKSQFHRGFKAQFFPGFYKITRVKTHLPIPMYEIGDLSHSNAKIMRSFYGNELQKVTGPVKGKKTGRSRINHALGGVREIEMELEGFPQKYFVQESKLADWLGRPSHDDGSGK